ncbi:DUF4157 domain-containing protein [Chitinophaga sp.]|uniref:eCIS core domain-containing protein n=1 Tax=Chitinophaga sp. TaxID=1869181 RepID=UPI0031D77A96
MAQAYANDVSNPLMPSAQHITSGGASHPAVPVWQKKDEDQDNALQVKQPAVVSVFDSVTGNDLLQRGFNTQGVINSADAVVQLTPFIPFVTAEAVTQAHQVTRFDPPRPQKTVNAPSLAKTFQLKQNKPDNTGLPGSLKAGIEKLSGHSLDNVKVHYNSAKPAQLNAHAYAQGTDIHIAPGEERHLPHEAWHVVQQARGQVKPTIKTDGTAINNDPGLESEADIMGAKALQLKSEENNSSAVADQVKSTKSTQNEVSQYMPVAQLAALAVDKLNVVGEDHEESSGPRRQKEYNLSVAKTGSYNYWLESMFKLDWSQVHQEDESENTQSADPTLERVRYIMADFSIKLESAFTKLDHVLPGEVDDAPLEDVPVVEPDNSSQVEHQAQTNVKNDDHDKEVEDVDLEAAFREELRNTLVSLKKSATDLAIQIDIAVIEEFYKHTHHLTQPEPPATKIVGVSDIQRVAIELKDMVTALVLVVEFQELTEPLTGVTYKLKDLHDRCQANGWIPNGEQMINSPAQAMNDAKEYRSFVMHLAANKNFTVPGVWKIGEDHVSDILRMLDEGNVSPVRYNLLTRAEFQEIYDEYYTTVNAVTQVKQLIKDNEEAGPERVLQPGQFSQLAIIQRMYEDAKDDIEPILDWLLETFENEDRAEEISNLSELDNVTEKDLKSVLLWVKDPEYQVAASLKAALNQGNEAFATLLLELIANPPQKVDASSSDLGSGSSIKQFEELIGQALQIHVPFVGAKIDAAHERAKRLGKKLLVIVGEGHDDPYSRVMVTILVGAMQRLNVSRFYIESTPDQVRQHVEPYHDNEPTQHDGSDIAHRQHFFRNLYQQGANVTGVDIYKNTGSESTTTEPISEKERTELKAVLAELNVKKRNEGIAKTLVEHDESGVLLVGMSHLAGLAADETINEAYEIVTISTMLIEEAKSLNRIFYGRELDTTAGLSDLRDLYVGAAPDDMPMNVTAKDAYEIAAKMVINLNEL